MSEPVRTGHRAERLGACVPTIDGRRRRVVDNARVLHARTAFNGNRHVRSTHVGRDEFYSRWRQLRSRYNGDINLL